MSDHGGQIERHAIEQVPAPERHGKPWHFFRSRHWSPARSPSCSGWTLKGAVITIISRGRSTHAAMPQQGVDTVSIAAQVISVLNALPSRHVDSRFGGTGGAMTGA